MSYYRIRNFYMYRLLCISLLIGGLFVGCNAKEEESQPQKVIKKEGVLQKERSLTNPKRYKINMFFISQTGCGACEKVREYMQEKDIKRWMKKDFIVTEVDINFKEDLPFSWMKPFATPTLYFFDGNENEIVDAVVRRMSREDFVTTLKKVIEIRDMD